MEKILMKKNIMLYGTYYHSITVIHISIQDTSLSETQGLQHTCKNIPTH